MTSGFLQIPPRNEHPCLRLTLPTAERVVVFHHLVVAHAGRTSKSGNGENRSHLRFVCSFSLRHIVEKDAFAQQRIVSVMLTDVKENGAVVFLGKLYNIIPGKKPFTRAFNSAPSAFSYTAVELPPYFSGNCPFICRILPIVLLA